jgi:hypothetical protein
MRSEDFATPVDQLPPLRPPDAELSTDEDWDAPTYEDFCRIAMEVWPDAVFTRDEDFWYAELKSHPAFEVRIFHPGGLRFWEIDSTTTAAPNVFAGGHSYVSRATLTAALNALRDGYMAQAEMSRCAAEMIRKLIRKSRGMT